MIKKPCAPKSTLVNLKSMENIPITVEMAAELKNWKTKTGWGYTSICKRMKEQGLKPPHPESLAAWEGMKNKSLPPAHYEAVISTYKNLPNSEYNAPKRARKNDYIPITEEVVQAASFLSSKKISNKKLLSMFLAPKGLNEQTLSAIISGKNNTISEEHAQWILNAQQAFQDS